MKRNLLKCLCLPLGMLCIVLSACSEDDTEPAKKTAYMVTEFASTTIPESIPAEGGAYTMTFTTHTETRSQPAVPVFEAWQYRVTLGDAVGEPVTVSEPKTEVAVVIGTNYSKEPRAVVVEMAVVQDATPPQWIRIVEAEQEPALHDYCVTEYESTTIPETIPYAGGEYTLNFKTSIETRAADPIFVEWQYRVTLGDVVGEAVAVTEPKTEVTVVIGSNNSNEPRPVVVEMALAEDSDTPLQWTRIVEAEQDSEFHDYCVTKYESTTIPETVPYNGGGYKLNFKTSIETRAAEPIFVEWQYRVTLGDAVGEAIAVTEQTESIDVEITRNYTENQRDIVIEMADAGAEPQWTKIVQSRQDAALVQIGGFYWAKGNVTLLEGKFAIADKMSDLGLYFRHGSKYGVPSDGGSYAGTAYTPEAVQVALADIPYRQPNTDPCTMIDAGLRTPTYMELFQLYDREDYMNQHVLDGITGMGYLNSNYFIPFSGAMEIASGQISGKSQLGGYLGLGANYVGEGVIYVLNADYSMVDYDLAGLNMASLRCVKNVRQPSYVSHTPASVTDNASFKLTVTTDPGEFPAYEVDIEAEDGEIRSIDASPAEREVTLTVPVNDDVENREWRLFINRVYTGVSFVQPGKRDYANYVSHSPSKATYEAFTLSVTCESDMASFPVVIKGSDGLNLTQTGSKENPTVSFPIPENTGEERTLAIWVNGSDTGKSVLQEANPATKAFSVIWSEGYLTVVDGAYTFAAPKERGMYFKWMSKYGIKFEGAVSSSTKYQGVVYGPEEQSIPNYADVPGGDVDPCSFVAPAGTWRMPTSEQMLELVADGSKAFEKNAFRMCSDGMQEVYLASAGQLANDGLSVKSANIISVWTPDASKTKPGQYSYLMWLMSSESSKGSVSANGVLPQTAMMVRCVRDK